MWCGSTNLRWRGVCKASKNARCGHGKMVKHTSGFCCWLVVSWWLQLVVSHVSWVVSTLGFSQYMQFENVWCTPCAVCGIPNAPCGGGDGIWTKSKYVKIKVCALCLCSRMPCVVEGGGTKSKIKTGHKATSDLPVRADDIAAEVVLPAILWFPGISWSPGKTNVKA